jgi:hypothetical protein
MCGGREIQHTPEYNSSAVRLRCAMRATENAPPPAERRTPREECVCAHSRLFLAKRLLARANSITAVRGAPAEAPTLPCNA